MMAAGIGLNLAGNRLWGRLPALERLHLAPHLKVLTLECGETLFGMGDRPQTVYFPATALVSVRYGTGCGTSMEIGLIGAEGLVGIDGLLDPIAGPVGAVVQGGGLAFALSVGLLRQRFDRSAAVREICLGYLQATHCHTTELLACHLQHSVEQRMCRRLLAQMQLTGESVLSGTQQMFSQTLGVRRESISEVAAGLRRAGIIESSRGRIAVLDATGLAERACGCALQERDRSQIRPTYARPAVIQTHRSEICRLGAGNQAGMSRQI